MHRHPIVAEQKIYKALYRLRHNRCFHAAAGKPRLAEGRGVLFLFGWDDFIFALTLTSGNAVRTLTLGLYQKYVVGGITAGSMKD